jgi:hypothetical protein
MSSIVAPGSVALRGQQAPFAPALRAGVRRVLLVLAGLAAAALVARVAVGPLAAVRHIVVTGDLPLPQQEVLRVAGLVGGEPLVTLDAGLIAGRLEAVPTIRSAEVQKVFPGTVRIALRSRAAVALVLAEDAGRSRAALVDSEGVVFAVAGGQAVTDLPVVSGLEGRVGDQLPRQAAPILADLAALRERSPNVFRLLSEVAIAGADGSTAPGEYLLYLASSPVPLRARGSLDARLVQYGLLAVDLLSSQGKLGDIRELDLRGGEVVCRKADPGAPRPPAGKEG